jgi:O-antigen ligase
MIQPRSSLWFLVSLAVIPLIYVPTILDVTLTPRAIILSLLTIGIIAMTWRQPFRRTPVMLAWVVFASFNVLSLFVAQNFGEGIFRASLVLLLGAWLTAATQIMPQISVRAVMRTLTVLALILAVVTTFQLSDVGFNWIPGGEYPYGTMTTKNLLSSFLFLLLPATIAGALTDDRGWRWVAILASTLLVFIILVNQTRAVWLACVIGMGCGAVSILFTGKAAEFLRLFRKRFAGISIGVIACFVAVFVFHVGRHTNHTVTAADKMRSLTQYTSDTSSQMRLTVWKKSLRMYAEHPVLGVGAGNWKVEIPKYGLEEFPPYIQNGSMQWSEAHNDFLATLCETGLGGLLAYISVFVFGIYTAVRWLRRSIAPAEVVLSALIISTIVGVAVISFFDFPKARVEHMMFFALWLSLLPSQERQAQSWVKIIALIAVLPALALLIYRFWAETHELTLLQARVDQNWDVVEEECNKIYDPRLFTLDVLSTPILYYRAEARFMQGDYQGALQDNLAALEAHPNHFYTLNNTASCYVKTGNFKEGEVFYSKALAISPHFEESLLNLAAVYYERGAYQEALAMVSKCDTASPGSRAQITARVIRTRLQ